nr:immunoglobulin lambda-1 light chain-like isoform X3 [Paramormyrops kingsleyae]
MYPVVIISWLSFIFGFASSQIKQNPVVMTKINRVVRIECEVPINLNDNPLHWYRRVKNGALHRVSYLPAGSGKQESETGFTATKTASGTGYKSVLSVSKPKPDDTGDYYCAYWETTEGGYSYKLFGPGTKLVVSDRRTAHPSVTIYHNPKNRELLCVARNMFPDVLRMTWQKNDGSGLKDVDQKTVPTTIQEMKGTLSSLIISDKNGTEELEKYVCLVDHESYQKPEPFPVQVSTKGGNENSREAVSGQVTCQPKKSNDSSPDTDPIKKSELLTVSLSYCMLILKSLTYFGIMSVIIYKRSSQTS